jgi:sugar/nucleoside kinase (ribokinase family)
MLDLLATGYPSLDTIIPASRSPATGETALIDAPIDDERASLGGCGANVAVGLARLGLHTGVAMVLGDDAAAERYSAYLAAEGVDVQNLSRLSGHATSRSYLFRSPDGDYQNFFFPGAADAWQGELSLVGLAQTRWGLLTVGYYPYNVQFAAALSRVGIPLIWQLKPDVAAYPRSGLEQFARDSRIIFCNRIEADYLCRGLGLDDLRELLARETRLLILTMGNAGSRVLTRDGAWDVPAVSRKVVDTTGAGDAFTAGFLAGYFRDYAPHVCGQIGAVVASFVLEQIGCQTNLPTWAQMQERYTEFFGEL